MSDIVGRLRDWPTMTPFACKEAADEIERLKAAVAAEIQRRDWEIGEHRKSQAEIERLKAALRLTCTVPLPDRIYQAVAAALERSHERPNR